MGLPSSSRWRDSGRPSSSLLLSESAARKVRTTQAQTKALMQTQISMMGKRISGTPFFMSTRPAAAILDSPVNGSCSGGSSAGGGSGVGKLPPLAESGPLEAAMMPSTALSSWIRIAKKALKSPSCPPVRNASCIAAGAISAECVIVTTTFTDPGCSSTETLSSATPAVLATCPLMVPSTLCLRAGSASSWSKTSPSSTKEICVVAVGPVAVADVVVVVVGTAQRERARRAARGNLSPPL
mmetsp:Transcript_43967/g.130190  ORF Transcript_43967/g.130190 Transcript_43967/m.130190 type:complete len:240 (+) Transcript_43967:382-1101(+)